MTCQRAMWMTLVVGTLVPFVYGEFVEPPPSFSLRSVAGTITRLPCLFQVGTEKVVQVSWMREKPGGTKEMVITVHRTEGHKEFGTFLGRVHFESSNPMTNAALVIQNTEVSDEGQYTCKISTFPLGNFERQLTLTVWTTPIFSLDPVVLVEGQALRVAATCRSMARPLPMLSWDTDVVGQIQNRSSNNGAVSSYFSVEPLRSMDGKKLDCLVRHPTMKEPHRIANRLVVYYPPEATIGGYKQKWFVGQEQASLKCKASGNPVPQNFLWSRNSGPLPTGVSVKGGTLLFSRPLFATDSGVYECVASNSAGIGKESVEIMVTDVHKLVFQSPATITVLCGIAGALLMVTVVSLIAVKCYYWYKKKNLEKQLDEKKEELVSLSRQNSIRRLNSVNSDPRIQMEEDIPLRPGSALCTLRDFPGRSHSRYSGRRQSMLEEKLEALSARSLQSSSWRGELEGMEDVEHKLTVKSLRNSSMSLTVSSVTEGDRMQRLGSRDRLSFKRTSLSGPQHLGSRNTLSLTQTSIARGAGTQHLDSRDPLSSARTSITIGSGTQHLDSRDPLSSARTSITIGSGTQRLDSRDLLSPARTSIVGGSGTQHLDSKDPLSSTQTSITRGSGTRHLENIDQLTPTWASVSGVTETQQLELNDLESPFWKNGARAPEMQHLGSTSQASPAYISKEKWEGPEEEDEEEDRKIIYNQISEALSNHFYYSDGVLRPKSHFNAILLHPKGQII